MHDSVIDSHWLRGSAVPAVFFLERKIVCLDGRKVAVPDIYIVEFRGYGYWHRSYSDLYQSVFGGIL